MKIRKTLVLVAVGFVVACFHEVPKQNTDVVVVSTLSASPPPSIAASTDTVPHTVSSPTVTVTAAPGANLGVNISVANPEVKVLIATSSEEALYPAARNFALVGNKSTEVTVSLATISDTVDIYRNTGLFGDFEKDATITKTIDRKTQSVTFTGRPGSYFVSSGELKMDFKDFYLPSPPPVVSVQETIQSVRRVHALSDYSTADIPADEIASATNRPLIILAHGHNMEYKPDNGWRSLLTELGSLTASADIVNIQWKSANSHLEAAQKIVSTIKKSGQEATIICHSAGCLVARLAEVLLGPESQLMNIHMLAPANRGSSLANITKDIELMSRHPGGAFELAALLAVHMKYDLRTDYTRRFPISQYMTHLSDVYLTDGRLSLAGDDVVEPTPVRPYLLRLFPVGFLAGVLTPESNRTIMCEMAGYRSVAPTVPKYYDVLGNCFENYSGGLTKAEELRELLPRKNWRIYAGYSKVSEFLEKAKPLEDIIRRGRVDLIQKMSEDEQVAGGLALGSKWISQMARVPDGRAIPDSIFNDGAVTVLDQMMASNGLPPLVTAGTPLTDLTPSAIALEKRKNPRTIDQYFYADVNHDAILKNSAPLAQVRKNISAEIVDRSAIPFEFTESDQVQITRRIAKSKKYTEGVRYITFREFRPIGPQVYVFVETTACYSCTIHISRCSFRKKGRVWLWDGWYQFF